MDEELAIAVCITFAEYLRKKYGIELTILALNTSFLLMIQTDAITKNVWKTLEFWLDQPLISEIPFDWRCGIVKQIVNRIESETKCGLTIIEGSLILKVVSMLANFCNS